MKKNTLMHIKNYKEEYKDNQNILAKYIWIEEFIKWLTKKDSSLKFKYLIDDDRLKQIL